MCFDMLPGISSDVPAADSYVDCNNPDDFPHDYIESKVGLIFESDLYPRAAVCGFEQSFR